MIKDLLVGSIVLGKELTKEQFLEELDEMQESFVAIHIEGEISTLLQVESFDYYSYENEETFYECLNIQDNEQPDSYILQINIDTCMEFYKDEATGQLRTVTENGMVIQFEQC